jgi:hypothetical protein
MMQDCYEAKFTTKFFTLFLKLITKPSISLSMGKLKKNAPKRLFFRIKLEHQKEVWVVPFWIHCTSILAASQSPSFRAVVPLFDVQAQPIYSLKLQIENMIHQPHERTKLLTHTPLL